MTLKLVSLNFPPYMHSVTFWQDEARFGKPAATVRCGQILKSSGYSSLMHSTYMFL